VSPEVPAKRGLDLELACTLLDARLPGTQALEIFDEAHSDDEERCIAIGPIRRGLALVV